MNIRRVKYTMKKNGEVKIGYVVGKHDGDNRTLLDENFNYVPKIDGQWICYSLRTDFDSYLNLTVPL